MWTNSTICTRSSTSRSGYTLPTLDSAGAETGYTAARTQDQQSVLPPRVNEDGEPHKNERHPSDHRRTNDSPEDHARRVRSDGQEHHGPCASRLARAPERREANTRREGEPQSGPA